MTKGKEDSSKVSQPTLKAVDCRECVHKNICPAFMAIKKFLSCGFIGLSFRGLEKAVPIDEPGNVQFMNQFGTEIRVISCIHYLPNTNVIHT
jgi:hypothetical protein